ncbi:uncharacterized protein LOC111642900 [Copidosoma floridanum]|uniref:uncharacterized protein LOC111642900 n=1 Tax=Copidosoma floridanum TaxID=29053 RepID=UPI000C6F8B47|nr:uncharacterized protein LOC111642900 [Copidosoma floridanum]
MDRSASCASENLKLKNVKSFEARGEHRSFMSKEEGEHTVAKDFAKFEGNEVNFSETSRFPTMESQHQADTENRIRPAVASGSTDDSGGDKGASGGTKKKKSSTKQRTIHVLDCLVSATVIGPMVIAHWRGIWVLMDFYENTFSGWACFTFGLGLHLLFAAWKHHLHRLFASDAETKGPCGRLGRRVVRSLYTYAFSLACNCHWRGAWVLLNDTFGTQAG